MGKKNILGNVTLSHIHKTVISSTSIKQAANKLQVCSDTLSTYLHRILYKKPINYSFLKGIPLEHAEQEFSAIYQKPLKDIISADEKVWVYFGTGRIYDEKVDETQLMNTREKNGQIELGDLCQKDGQCIRLELILKEIQRQRKKVWVYLGTNRLFEGKVDETELVNMIENNNHIVQGDLMQEDGQSIQLELIAKSAQKQRKKIWIYCGTNRIYREKVDETQLTKTKKKNGRIIQGDLRREDSQTVRLELIAKNALQLRKKVWVHLGTSRLYEGKVDETQLTNAIEKDGYIVEGDLLQEDGEFIRLELIAKGAQQQRKSDQSIRLELTSKQENQSRKKVWVHLGTGRIYSGTVDEKQLTDIKEKNGYIVQGDLLQADGHSIRLELILKQTQQRRTGVWVHLGTGRIYNGIVDEKQLVDIGVKDGQIVRGDLLQADGQIIQLEIIKRSQCSQRGLWFLFGGDKIYYDIADYKKLKVYRKQDIACYQHPQQEDALVLYFTSDLAGIACINARVIASFINKEIKDAWRTYATIEEFDATENASSRRNFVILNKFSALFSLLYEGNLPVWLEKLGGHDNCKDYPQMPEEIRHLFITHSPVSCERAQQNNTSVADSLLNEPEFQAMDFNFSDELAFLESKLFNNLDEDEQEDFSSIFTSGEANVTEFSLEDELFKDTSGESSNIWRNFEDYDAFYQSFMLSSVVNQNASIGEDSSNERGELLSNKNNSYLPEFFSNSQEQSFDCVVSEKNDEMSNIPYSPSGFFSSRKHHCENRVEDSNSNKKMRIAYLLGCEMICK